ncbi:hypothetical protein HK100_010613 [Physocladia obscura]|uniref:SH3 domain-containing protein n=1 Tax=Physocladia obscura TaxID=109957 RepID=A0AAD5T4X7_9FUNG|nr:hypothetical protein HK100_010613 [Physocladia obscura]
MGSLFRSKSLSRSNTTKSLEDGGIEGGGSDGIGFGSSGQGLNGVISNSNGNGNTLVRGGTLTRSNTLTATLARMGTLRKVRVEEPPVLLSDSGLPMSAPTTIVVPPPINYSLRGATLDPQPAAKQLFNALSASADANREVAPNPVKLHMSKVSQTTPTTLKWWQAPGVTKETQAALSEAAARDNKDGGNGKDGKESEELGKNESLPRTKFLSHSLGRNNSASASGAGALGTPPRAKFHQYEEVAIIKTEHENQTRGPQFGTVPNLVDKCGAGTTTTVLHAFASLSATELALCVDDIVRILRVDPGGWVLVKLLKLSSAATNSGTNPGVNPSTAAGNRRSVVGMEGLVPLGILDTMKSRPVLISGGAPQVLGSISNLSNRQPEIAPGRPSEFVSTRNNRAINNSNSNNNNNSSNINNPVVDIGDSGSRLARQPSQQRQQQQQQQQQRQPQQFPQQQQQQFQQNLQQQQLSQQQFTQQQQQHASNWKIGRTKANAKHVAWVKEREEVATVLVEYK